MAKFKCPYCGALSDKDGICSQCDIARVEPYFEEIVIEPKWVTTKLVFGILSMVLFVIILFQSCAAGIGNALSQNGEVSGTTGFIVALNLLTAGIILVAARKSTKKAPMIICAVLLWLNYFFAKMLSGSYKDLVVWGFLSYALGVFCLLSAMHAKKQYIIVGIISAIYLIIALI